MPAKRGSDTSGLADSEAWQSRIRTLREEAPMTGPFKGVVNVDIKDSTPDWGPYTQPMAPEGAPNVLYVVLDDVGFSAIEPFGGLIETPNVKRLVDAGLTYTNFHTTALCSPTRSCLMTGRNHTSNGMACITEATAGFPNANDVWLRPVIKHER